MIFTLSCKVQKVSKKKKKIESAFLILTTCTHQLCSTVIDAFLLHLKKKNSNKCSTFKVVFTFIKKDEIKISLILFSFFGFGKAALEPLGILDGSSVIDFLVVGDQTFAPLKPEDFKRPY